jgi:polar amino acid transport system permease protein
MLFDWSSVTRYLDLIEQGLFLTIQISVVAFSGAFALGLVGALARRSRLLPLRLIAATYVEVLRNTPCMLQIFVVYFALPSFGLKFDNVVAGEIALALNVGAYMTEVFRAGIQSISSGQIEAAASLGLSGTQIFRHVVFPQAIQNIYPPLINMVTITILGSSLLTAIAVPELLGSALVIQSRTFRTIEIFAVVTGIYFVLTFGTSTLMNLLGRRLFPARARL